MKSIPVASEKLEFTFVECVGLFDRESGVQRSDKEGTPQWELRCLVRQVGTEFRPEMLPVKVASRRDLSEVLTPFVPVEFTDLQAFAWAIHEGRGNDGVSFSASGVATIKPSVNGSKAPKVEQSAVSS